MDKNFILAFDNDGNTHYVNLKYVMRSYVTHRADSWHVVAQLTLEPNGTELVTLAHYPSREEAQKNLEETFNNFTCTHQYSNNGFQVVESH